MVLSLDKFKIVLSLEAVCVIMANSGFLCQNLSDSESTVPFRSVLIMVHAFYLVLMYSILKVLGIWRACIFVICRVSVQAQEDCTQMDIEVRQGSSLTTVPH